MTVERPDSRDADDLHGEDSFPASDPPSTWAGSGKWNSPSGVRDAHDRLLSAAEELMRRGRDGVGMTATTTLYRQLALAQLLQAIAHAVEAGQELPDELVRHASTLSQHILAYPAASAQPPAEDPSTAC